MGSKPPREVGSFGDGGDDRQGGPSTKGRIDFWRSLLPKKDSSPRTESNDERMSRLAKQVQQASDLYSRHPEIFLQLGYSQQVHSHILEVQRKAHQAYTQKNSNRRQIIDILENTSKTLLEISKQFEAIEPHLKEARQGFEKFKQSYEAGDQSWKDFLTKTDLGKDLQAVYLGVKPLMTIYRSQIKAEIMAKAIKHYTGDDLTVLDVRDSGRGIMIFHESSIKKIFVAYLNDFPNYSPELSIASYISDLGKSLEGRTTEQLELQRGLLHGFPLTASKQFARHGSQLDRLIDRYEENRELSEEDRSLMGRYLSFTDKGITNKFRDDHQEEIGDLLNRHFPDMDNQSKQYIRALRYIEAPGFVYMSDNPTSNEDRDFTQKVRDIFDVSGMSSFLQQIKNK